MPIIDQTATLPSAGALTGAEQVAVIDTDGLPTQTTTSAIGALAGPSLSVTVGSQVDHKRILLIQANRAGVVNFWLELVSAADASYAVSDEGAGSIVYDNTTLKRTLCTTNASGTAQIGITDTAAETIKVALGSGPGTGPVTGSVTTLTFT